MEGLGGLLDTARTPGIGELTALVNTAAEECARSPETRWVLVLDDFHVITSPEVHQATEFLLEHLPPGVHLVMTTRSDPPLPLSRLRTRDQLTELRAADLRFTRPEAEEFLTSVMGLALTASDVDALEDRTEGWAAGLQLAALSLRGVEERDQVSGFIEAFTGSSRFVIDYLVDEVLARQIEEVRDFLLHTAVLERLSGPLCDQVTERTDSARLLADLERDSLFVVALDTERAWYRYHHLFADVLHARLLAEQPEHVPLLHQRASEWFAAHDLLPDAVRHALAAEDHDRARLLMEFALPEMRRARQDALLMSWATSLPDAVVRRSPVLSIVKAWSKLMSGNLDAVEPWLADAEAALAAGSADPEVAATWADTEDLRTASAMIAVYRASAAQARGDVAGTVSHARIAVEQAGPDDHFVRAAGSGFLGLAAFAAGDVTEALTTFSEAVHHLHAAGNLVDELDSTIVLADMWRAAGRPSRARSPTHAPPPTCTSVWRSSTASSVTSPVRRPTSNERDPSPSARPSARTATAGTPSWRSCNHGSATSPLPWTSSRRPRRSTVLASTPICGRSRRCGRASSWRTVTSGRSRSGRSSTVSSSTTSRRTSASTSTSPWCGC
jgi:LuxR family maltose regulon positive regulatory protein